ncbi:hypothetical protein CI610_00238 [invertebrate metagenome]|uniref:Uncharacterized protein n=1 Tax=invertebrate metagenome TaxID=1711999 RepID=A0A2H9TBX7_9ZZZZ
MVTSGKLSHALTDAFSDEVLKECYENGYLMISKVKEDECTLAMVKSTLENKETLGKLKVLPQWIMNESSKVTQLHVLAAAPSFQRDRKPSEGSVLTKLCQALVKAQYEAIAKIAVIKSKLPSD